MPARSINFVGSINRKSCCIPSFLLAKRLRRTSNQRVHKYCIALSPERHHGPWHTAVFTIHWSVFSFAAGDTRGDDKFNYFKLVTKLRQLDSDVVVQLQTEEQRNTGKRVSKAKARRVLHHLLQSSPAVTLCCSGGGRLVCHWCRAAQSNWEAERNRHQATSVISTNYLNRLPTVAGRDTH